MLSHFKGISSQHSQAAASSFNVLCGRPVATLLTVMVIALTLTLPTLFWIFSHHLSEVTQDWQRNGSISLYLKPSLSSAEQNQLLVSVRHLPGVEDAKLKTPAEGLHELESQEGMSDILRYLPGNPLPPVIEITPNLNQKTPTELEALYDRVKALSGVEQAKLDMDWVRRLHAILGVSSALANAFMILLASVVVLIVGNTLRLAIQNRQEEIRLLKLVGASDPFIVRPFLYTGFWYGLLCGVFAVLFVNIFLLTLAVILQSLASLYHMHYPLKGLSIFEAYLIVVGSILLSWVGACISAKRQMAFIDPYN